MKRLAVISVAAVLASGCATSPDSQGQQSNRTATGAVIGAVAGAVLGHQIKHDGGAAIGAVVGGATGAAIGNSMDEQEREYRRELESERRQNQIEVERVRDDLLKLTLDSEVSFDFDKAAIKPAFKPTLDKLAEVMRKYDRTNIIIVGHTDAIGSESYNQRLSERRAEAVADYLSSKGVARYRFTTRGAGESEPRATNDTEAGRQLNRRVEIFVQPDAEQYRGSGSGSGSGDDRYRDERYNDDRYRGTDSQYRY